MIAKKRLPPSRARPGPGIVRPTAGEALASRLPALIAAWRGNHGGPRGELSRREIEEAGSALLSLQRGLTGDRRLAGADYMDRSDLLGAYLLYYWPVSYMQVSLALAEGGSPRIDGARRILDLGSGPGPASAAILDALAETDAPPPEELVLADSSPKALDLASALLASGPHASKRTTSRLLDLEKPSVLPEGDFDLIVMGHCLNELWRGRNGALDLRAELLRALGDRLAPGGIVLLVEPALLATSRELIALRDRLASEGWSILGPCPSPRPCPIYAAGSERTCHSESPWSPPEPVASLAAAAGLDRSSVKWTHFFLTTPGAEGAAARDATGAPRRIVSDPMLNKAGRLRYILCGEGALATISARADDEAARAAGFASLRRGDLFRVENLEERPGGGLGFGPGSRLEIAAPAPEAAG